MKYINYLLITIISVASLSCNNKSTYKITKIIVKPDSLYSDEDRNLLGKPLTIETSNNDKAITLTIDGQAPILLQFDSRNNDYDKTHKPMDYDMAYNGQFNKTGYDLHLFKDADESNLIELYISKSGKSSSETRTSNMTGIAGAIMSTSRNQVHITIIAKP